ncbi:hypothetical protein [Zhihengliuella sp.]|uniref:hypothetical protein n=1 Tax=Zhihengliuella sp. TaxID=1954483 RepID=UPI002810FC79|nr:hypothetical protein [Zhihengliuella sp.]
MSTGPNVLSFKETVVRRRTTRRVGLFRRLKAVELTQSIWNIQVDGRLLQAWIRDWSGTLDMPAEMADLRSTFPAAGLLRIDDLLGAGDGPPSQPLGLLFCPICRSEACGYLACDLQIGERVTWSGFRWQDTVDGRPRVTPVAGAETLVFDTETYRRTLLELRETIAPIVGHAAEAEERASH